MEKWANELRERVNDFADAPVILVAMRQRFGTPKETSWDGSDTLMQRKVWEDRTPAAPRRPLRQQHDRGTGAVVRGGRRQPHARDMLKTLTEAAGRERAGQIRRPGLEAFKGTTPPPVKFAAFFEALKGSAGLAKLDNKKLRRHLNIVTGDGRDDLLGWTSAPSASTGSSSRPVGGGTCTRRRP